MSKAQKKSWPKVGTIRRGDDGTNYIKLESNVKILVDGEEVELNKARTLQLQDPRAKVKMLQERGYIDEATADARLEKLAENQWLRYEIVAPPPRVN